MLPPSSFTTLGTGGGPGLNPVRAQPAHLLMAGDTPVLIDCGEGAMTQLRRVGVEFRNVDHIVLTHHHFDHIGSLFACIGLNMMVHRRKPLNIYGPPGTRRILDGLFAACGVPQEVGFGATDRQLPRPEDFVSVHELTPGDETSLPGLVMTSCENTHYRPEHDLGKPGPLSLALRFDLDDRSVVFTGDTGTCQAVEALAKDVDLLVGEMVDAELVLARVRKMNPEATDDHVDRIAQHMFQHHLTAEQLGEMAASAGAKKLVAVHFTPGSVLPENAHEYLARVKSRYDGEVHLAADLQTY